MMKYSEKEVLTILALFSPTSFSLLVVNKITSDEFKLTLRKTEGIMTF